MRERWRTVSRLWEEKRAEANKLDLLGQLDYYGKLSAQLRWRQDPGGKPVRVVYTTSGQPTAALLSENNAIVTERLYWLTCKDLEEANYLLAVINSNRLYEVVGSLMSRGLFGARDLHNHLWKLPIPEFDPNDALHAAVSEAGKAAAAGAARQLAQLRADRGDELTVAIARRELRRWLRTLAEGKAVEAVVGRLLGGGVGLQDEGDGRLDEADTAHA